MGIVIINIDWIQSRFQQQAELFKSLFHPEEIHYCDTYRFSAPHYAGRYAAKQAVRKALGLDFQEETTLQEVSIFRMSTGQPVVHLLGQTLVWTQLLGNDIQFFLSISHSRSHAIAFVVTEKK
ncbi:MAG: holo-ACP synthase [Planctomycetota bacterium]